MVFDRHRAVNELIGTPLFPNLRVSIFPRDVSASG